MSKTPISPRKDSQSERKTTVSQARRKLLKASAAVPLVATLQPGAALATTSIHACKKPDYDKDRHPKYCKTKDHVVRQKTKRYTTSHYKCDVKKGHDGRYSLYKKDKDDNHGWGGGNNWGHKDDWGGKWGYDSNGNFGKQSKPKKGGKGGKDYDKESINLPKELYGLEGKYYDDKGDEHRFNDDIIHAYYEEEETHVLVMFDKGHNYMDRKGPWPKFQPMHGHEPLSQSCLTSLQDAGYMI